MTFNFTTHLHRQRDWSIRTFGPAKRTLGVCEHIRKELGEVISSGHDLAECIDVVILGFDLCIRSGATPEQIVAALVAKQEKNEARVWPDWRGRGEHEAIEHVRGEHD